MLVDKEGNPSDIKDSPATSSVEADTVEKQVTETKITEPVTEEEEQEEIEEEEEEEEEDDEDFSRFDEISSDNTDIDNKINAFTNDKTNNPYGLSEINDMQTYLQKFRPSERSSVASALTTGEISYMCR